MSTSSIAERTAADVYTTMRQEIERAYVTIFNGIAHQLAAVSPSTPSEEYLRAFDEAWSDCLRAG